MEPLVMLMCNHALHGKEHGKLVTQWTFYVQLVLQLHLQLPAELSICRIKIKVCLKLQGARLGASYEELTPASVPGPTSS